MYFLRRVLRQRQYLRTLGERLGFLPARFRQAVPGAIWLHAVSVGEVAAAGELARQLRARFPRSPLFVSTTTLAGRATAEKRLDGLAAGIFYAPLDFVFAVRRVLRALQPAVVIVLETEIWPNLFREVKRTGAGLLMANGRISERTVRRYHRLRPFFGCVLAHADAILTQSEAMRERFVSIGAPVGRTRDAGNLKYDFKPAPAPADSPVRALTASARVWVAASTMPPAVPGDPDEDEVVIAAFRELAPRHPDLLLILAPRRPERFDPAAERLAGIPHLRRSQLKPGGTIPLPGVLLLDTIGELAGVFFLADVVFMGGTLAHRGGHNILEPAAAARPVITGPHMENFREIAEEFYAAGASVQIAAAGELAGAVSALLSDIPRAEEIGRRALACAEARRGATACVVEAAAELLERSLPCRRPALPALAALWPLAKLWEWGGVLKRAMTRPRTLDATVISVGNVTMGGTGKTPFVLLLARMLAGRRPAVLTRGYGRHTPGKYLAIAAGETAPRAVTGDEAQMFLRAGLAVGIGPDRYRAGRSLDAGVYILDDGFQHARVGRQLDIVLIDALDPFGGCRVFPLGRLREPLRALARADLFVITRANYGRLTDAIEHRLRELNPRAPVLRAAVVPEAAPPARPAAAFCGLGNPESFWATLESLGVRLVERVEFEDHHLYRPHELRRMAEHFRTAGAEVAITTEKDALNLPPDAEALLAPLTLCTVRIRMEVESPEELARLLP